MRVLNFRRLVVGLTGCTAFVCAAGALAQTTQVETFTAAGVVNCTMPGTPNGGGLTFSTNATLQSVDFTAGSVIFNGTAVDFDGQEAAFLASTYNAGVQTPVHSGPATVVVTGTGTIGGGGFGGGGGGCRVVGSNVPLGPLFSSSRLDIATGPGVNLTTIVPVWSSSSLPQLNGHGVTADGPLNITSVDAVNGIVNFTLSGKIFAGNTVVPALTTLGFICLAIGLFGLAVLALTRRTPRRSGSSA
jgi:hypothetical protein